VIEFRLLKSKTMLDASLVELSEKLSPDQHTVKNDSGDIVAFWLPIYTLDKNPFFSIDTNVINDLLHRETEQGEIEILVEKDIYDISNEHIQQIFVNPSGLPPLPTPNVNTLFFKLNEEGGILLTDMTSDVIKQNNDHSVNNYFCCILNNKILCIIELKSPIRSPEFFFTLHYRDETERVKQAKELYSIRKRLGFR